MNLIETWLEAEAILGNSNQEAVNQMNEILGTKYTLSRVGEWRRGVRNPDATAHRYMVMNAMTHAFGKADPAALAALKEVTDLPAFLWVVTQSITLGV